MDSYGLDLLATMIDAGTHETIAQFAESLRNRSKFKKIEKIAEAESKAMLIKLETMCGFSQEEAQSILRTVILRNLHDSNYSEILGIALPLIEPTAVIEKVSKDWLLLHYDKASKYSDEQIQYLWAKILAGELNDPGSFSTRTLAIVEQLTKETAEIFNNLASFEFCIDEEIPRIIIFDDTSEIYTKKSVFAQC